jgi:hypothetical protein
MRYLVIVMLFGTSACSGGGSGTPANCSEYLAVGNVVATACSNPAPTNAVLTACQSQVSQCNSDDVAILQQVQTCLGLLTTCDNSAIRNCIAPRSNLSQACQVAVNVVSSAYQSQ